jgi:cephalosporin-C deacetylase-like acetyl esterase
MSSSWELRTCRADRLGPAELKALLLALFVGYIAVTGLVWLSQERLIFHPRSAAAVVTAPTGWRLEEVAFRATDGTRLAGVLLLPPLTPLQPLVIYFAGNAEEATEGASGARDDYGVRAVLLMNYRGYGKSEGRPSERALVADALQVFDWAAKHPEIDPARIAVHGRSLGSGIAVPVAAARPVKCVVLTSPFGSALDVAREMYPWLPVKLLLRHSFDSVYLAPAVKARALILVGQDDNIIPPHHSQRLAKAWGGPVDRAEFNGVGHNDLQIHPEYGMAVRAFLDRNL